jgi:hypothetical protein
MSLLSRPYANPEPMGACWDHLMALPEDIQDEFGNYHRALLEAVKIWRDAACGGPKPQSPQRGLVTRIC